MVGSMWYAQDKLVIDAIKVWHMGDDSASTDSLSYALLSYTISSSGSTSGNLTEGNTLVGSSSSQTIDNADMDAHSITVSNATVDAGRAIFMMVRGGSSTNNDITAQVDIKYHLF